MKGIVEWKEGDVVIGPIACDADMMVFPLKSEIFLTSALKVGEKMLALEMGYDKESALDLAGVLLNGYDDDRGELAEFNPEGLENIAQFEWVNGEMHVRNISMKVYDIFEYVTAHTILSKNESRQMAHEIKLSVELLESAEGFIDADDLSKGFPKKYDKLMDNLVKYHLSWREIRYGW